MNSIPPLVFILHQKGNKSIPNQTIFSLKNDRDFSTIPVVTRLIKRTNAQG